jgi:hypothetical protein
MKAQLESLGCAVLIMAMGIWNAREAKAGLSGAWAVEGGVVGAALGESATTAGDVNGDGYSDAVVGAPGGSGAAYAYYGSPSGVSSSASWSALK